MPLSHRKNYIICAPSYRGSAGIRMLYKLRDELENRGFNAKIFCYDYGVKNELDQKIFIKNISSRNREEDIVIYPETVIGNPLLFKNVVRYMLNKPGFGGGEPTYHHGEMLFAFDRYCHDTAPMLRLDMLDRDLFFDAGKTKDVNCYFVYKGGKFREIPEIKGCIEINKNYPPTRRELAELLQRTDTLYSYDNNSCLLQEAALCGAKVKIIRENDIIDYCFRDEYDEGAFKTQMDNFIKTTQSMHFSGPVNRTGYYPLTEYLRRYMMRCLLRVVYIMTHSRHIKCKLKEIKSSSPHIYGGKYVF